MVFGSHRGVWLLCPSVVVVPSSAGVAWGKKRFDRRSGHETQTANKPSVTEYPEPQHNHNTPGDGWTTRCRQGRQDTLGSKNNGPPTLVHMVYGFTTSAYLQVDAATPTPPDASKLADDRRCGTLKKINRPTRRDEKRRTDPCTSDILYHHKRLYTRRSSNTCPPAPLPRFKSRVLPAIPTAGLQNKTKKLTGSY